jgi:hypothetical protein
VLETLDSRQDILAQKWQAAQIDSVASRDDHVVSEMIDNRAVSPRES